jgi:hypothetical protein
MGSARERENCLSLTIFPLPFCYRKSVRDYKMVMGFSRLHGCASPCANGTKKGDYEIACIVCIE